MNRTGKKDGLYVYYSKPKLLGVLSSDKLRQWVRSGAEGKLERAVLAGQGHRLLAEAEALPVSRHLTNMIQKCDALHAAIEKGSLLELQELLDYDYNRHKYVRCFDEAGAGLLHKAVYYNYMDIVGWLVDNYPQLVHQRDSFGRTPLHYTAACREEAAVAALLERAGAARGVRDAAGRSLAHYRAARTLLVLPTAADMPARPNVNPPGFLIKRHNIRIWCHECDMGRLQRVVWEGQGARLLSEVSSQPVVRKFLEAVPYIMNTIRDIHNAVIQNDLEAIMKLTSDPVPPQALSSRDANHMTAMHKAAGLGHCGILKYIIERYPQGISDVDNDGRTPLHYAAVVKDDQHTYNTLISAGADESAVDNKNKTPTYYINRSQDIDKSLFKTLPEAPRTPSSNYPSSWDWKILDTEFIGDFNKKTRKKTLKASNENISSKNNTSTISDTIESNNVALKNSSTHELISDLPDLNDVDKEKLQIVSNEDDKQNIKETTEIQDSKESNEEVENSLNIKDSTAEVKTVNSDNNEIESVSHEPMLDEEENAGLNGKFEIEVSNDDVTNNKCNDDKDEETEENISESNLKTHKQDKNNEQNKENYDAEKDEVITEINKQEEKTELTKETADEKVLTPENTHESPQRVLRENHSNENHLESNTYVRNNDDDNNDIKKSINHVAEPSKGVEDHNNGNTENNINENQIGKQEEDPSKTTSSEGNTSNDKNEDDEDVQVQGSSYPEHSDIHIQSNTIRQSNGSARRGYVTNGRNIQENLIEGIITSEADQETQDASIAQRLIHSNNLIVDNEIDPEVTDLINTANMEMLATLVLNGEGSRLIGRQSGNAELQAFLDNVPIYMQKINKVHVAARDGNIRDLQAALDRRKFAIARDPISPNGATPLHVATVYGKTNILKYLGGRFPETLSAVDFEGRTALHFAAVLPDNGHYYNLLQQLGANSKDLDDIGRSAEDYYQNPTLFPCRQLLLDFGISDEKAQAMFSDQVPEDRVSSRRILCMPAAMDTLEQCYKLLASTKPSRTPQSASSNIATPPHVLGRFLKQPIFDEIKHRVTKLDHNLFDVIWPAVQKLPDSKSIVQIVEEDFPGGVSAPDYYVYEVFTEFLTPLVKDLHNINIQSILTDHPISDFVKSAHLTESSPPLVEINIDSNDEFILSGIIECSRNLEGFELPLNLKFGKLEMIERIVTTILIKEDFSRIVNQLSPESDPKAGTYYTLNEVLEKPSEISAILAASGTLIPLCDKEEIDDCTRLHGKQWPYGRGVFVSDDKSVAVWINVHDHIRVIISTPADFPGEIGLTFRKLTYIMTYLHEKFDFVFDHKLGHLSSRPTFLGAGIRFSLVVNIPGLSRDSDNIKNLCAMRGLQYRETLSTGIARISNYQCLNVTESACFNDFVTATSNLLHLEKDLSMQNSTHITTMLSNIFRRKRSSLAEINNVKQMQENH